jgi:hypothetical protein
MPGLRSYVKEIGEIRHRKAELFAIEKAKQRDRGVIWRHLSKELLAVVETRRELEAVCSRAVADRAA